MVMINIEKRKLALQCLVLDVLLPGVDAVFGMDGIRLLGGVTIGGEFDGILFGSNHTGSEDIKINNNNNNRNVVLAINNTGGESRSNNTGGESRSNNTGREFKSNNRGGGTNINNNTGTWR